MPTYSPLLRVELINTGDASGTWGNITNTNLGTLLEKAIAGTSSIDVTSGNVTLTSNDGADDTARSMILNVSGTPGTSRNIVAPSTSKVYVVLNGSDSSVVIKGSATTGVTVATGDNVVVAWDGSDFVVVAKVPSAGVGDVLGPASSTANAVATFNGTSGKLLQSSTKTLPSGTIVGTSDAQTLTNKTLTSPLFTSATESVTVSASGLGSSLNYDVLTQTVLFYSGSATSNTTLNIRASSSATLNDTLSNGQSITLSLLSSVGVANTYYVSTVQIDGVSQTVKWLNGTAPSAGFSNSVNAYTFTVIKTASATYTVLGSLARYG